jgi:alpha-tubulin suppressor-like RCC1 family protein
MTTTNRLFSTLLLVSTLLLPAFHLTAGDTPARTTGLRLPTPDELAEYHERMFVVSPTRAELPASAVNTRHLPVVDNQGSLGSCSAFAAGYYYKTYQEAREHGWVRPNPTVNPERVASPMWTFIATWRRDPDASVYQGISLYDALDLFCNNGCATWQQLPYDDQGSLLLPEADSIWRQAMQWRALQMGRIPGIDTETGLRLLKQHLAGGDIAVVGTTRLVRGNFSYDYPDGTGENGIDNQVYYRDAGESGSGRHALTVVGYNDEIAYTDDRTNTTRHGAFLLANSWGNWGTDAPTAGQTDGPATGSRGFIWIAYEYFLEGGFWPEALIMRDRTAYSPLYLARVGVTHPSCDVVNGSYAKLKTLLGTRRAIPALNQPDGVDRSFLLDVTDLISRPVCDLSLEFLQINDSDTGSFSEFSLESWDGAQIAGCPAAFPVGTAVRDLLGLHIRSMLAETVGLEELRLRHGAAAFADIDGDGDPDLVATGQRTMAETVAADTTLWLNNGDGSFTADTTLLPGTDNGELAWSDVDNDGDPDLWIGGDTDTRLYLNNAGTLADSGLSLPPTAAGLLAPADFNRDGRPDLALANAEGTYLYSQEADGSFRLLILDWPGVSTGTVHGTAGMLTWGDPNSDGLLDLLVTGVGDEARTVLYLNQGNETFTASYPGLPAWSDGATAWADFDNDGHEDLAVCGRDHAGGNTRLYRGVGDGTFAAVDVNGQLAGVYRGRLRWLDLDHDGRRDLLVSGREQDVYTSNPDYDYPLSTWPNRLQVYRNLGNDAFEDAQLELPGVSGYVGPNPLAVADVDGDGDVDLFAAGTRGRPHDTDSQYVQGIFVRNGSANFPSHGGANSAPSAPATLTATSNDSGSVTFAWSDSTDDVTPTTGLRYLLRLGSSPGAGDILSGISNPADSAALVRSGITYRNLTAGPLYWAVRSVDAGLAVSPWSTEQMISVPAYTPSAHIKLACFPNYAGTTSPAAGTVILNQNGTLVVTAQAAAGYVFTGWSGDATGLDNPLTWSATTNASLVANFEKRADASTPAWSQVSTDVGFGMGVTDAGLVFFNNRLYRLGGELRTGPTNAVWYSEATDTTALGEVWQQTSEHEFAPWSARSGHCTQVFNSRIWIYGGEDEQGTLLNDVWSSADGVTWSQATATAAWPARSNATGTVFAGKLWLLGGYSFASMTVYRDAWCSSDGLNWTQVTSSAAYPGTMNYDARPVALEFNNQLVMLTANSEWSTPGEVWSSPDGATWTQLTNQAPWSKRYSAAVFDNKLVVLGGFAADTGSLTNAVWESVDGLNWIQTAPQAGTAHWTARQGAALCLANDQLWLLGGKDDSGEYSTQHQKDVWSYGLGELPDDLGQLRLTATSGGSLIPPVGQYVDTLGKTFSLTASPDADYVFDGWEGPVASANSATSTVTLTRDTAVNARFRYVGPTPDNVTLTLAVSPAGSGTINPAGPLQTPRGQDRTITASAAAGFRFSHWEGPVAEPLALQTTVQPDSDLSVTAHFRPISTVAASSGHTALIWQDGTLWLWGNNSTGQLGFGFLESGEGLPALAAKTGVRETAVTSTGTLAVDTAGDVYAWGNPWSEPKPEEGEWTITPLKLEFGTTARQICAGTTHVLLVGKDGTLWTAGLNENGQLGQPGVGLWTQPGQVLGPAGAGKLTGIAYAAAGSGHSLAVDTLGRVWGWGRNANGELGPDLPMAMETPGRIAGLPIVTMLAAGTDTLAPASYALDQNGQVWSWGGNASGQLGDGNTSQRATPAKIADLNDIVAIAAGGRHALALNAAGTLYAWGDNSYGQLGDGTQIDRHRPSLVTGLPQIRSIAAGLHHSIAVAVDGRCFAWGDDSSGQASGSKGEDVRTPQELTGMNASASTLAVTLAASPSYGGATTPATGDYRARQESSLVCTATADERYVFSGWNGPVSEPEKAETSLTLIGPATITARFTLRPEANARLSLTANPADGGVLTPQAGDHDYSPGTPVEIQADHAARYRFSGWTGTVVDSSSRLTTVIMDRDQPVTATFERLPFQATPDISVADNKPMLLYSDGVARVQSNYGLANGAYPVSGLPGEIVQIVQTSGHSLALTAQGTIWAWGANSYGQCGNGEGGSSPDPASPVSVIGPNTDTPLTGIAQIAAGTYNSLALTTDGNILQWGVLPDYTDNNVHADRPVVLKTADGNDFDQVTQIAMGIGGTALAIRHDGTVWAWGRNYSGQLGNGTTADSATPVQVSALTNVVAISAGGSHCLAVLADGTVRAWGANSSGQLGNGTLADSATPVKVGSLTDIVAVAAGNRHSLALDSNGNLYAWGTNRVGQLGDGTHDDRTSPVQVSTLTDAVLLAASDESSFAITADGSLYSWGGRIADYAPQGLTTPQLNSQINVGTTTVQTYRLNLSVEPAMGGAIFPGSGTQFYNPDTEVELRASPAADYRFVGWDDGSGLLNPDERQTVTVTGDLSLTARFELVEPTLVLEHLEGAPGTTLAMRLILAEGKQEYAGLNATFHLPPGLEYVGVEPGEGLPAEFISDVALSKASDGGTLISLVTFSVDDLISERDTEICVFTLVPSMAAAAGVYPVTCLATSEPPGPPQAALSLADGATCIHPTSVSGSVTVLREHFVQTALRIVGTAALGDRLGDAEFAAYSGQTRQRLDLPYAAEIWLRYTGSGEAGVLGATLALSATGAAVTFTAVHHGGVFTGAPAGEISAGSVTGFGGFQPDGTGEALAGWVRLGWIEIQPEGSGETTLSLNWSGSLPALPGGLILTDADTSLLGSPVTVTYESNQTPVLPANSTFAASSEDGLFTLAGSDPNASDEGRLVFQILSQPEHGTIELLDARLGLCRYVPEAGFAGLESFTYQVSDGSATSEPATAQVSIGFNFELSLQTGWNLVSLPLAANDPSVEAIFGPAIAGPAWQWNRDHYEVASDLQPGRGCWVYVIPDASASPENSTTILTVSGQASTITSRSLESGWNLVGPIGTPDAAPLSLPLGTPQGARLSGVVWLWRNGTYVVPEALPLGQAAWLYLLSPADVSLLGTEQ